MTSLLIFLLQVVALGIPLWIAARWRRAYPDWGFVVLAGVLVVFSAIPLLAGIFTAIFQILGLSSLADLVSPLARPDFLLMMGFLAIANGVVLILVLLDFLWLPRKDWIQVERHTGTTASLAKDHQVELIISNLSNKPLRVWLADDLDEDLLADPPFLAYTLDPRSRTTLHYQLRARRRGKFVLPHVNLVLRSRTRGWRRFLKYPYRSEINVYPDLKQVEQYALLARQNRLTLLGVRRTRRIGGDNEFERLRDYTRDDNYRFIDWRSTARRNKLTVRDFQTDQSQRLLFLVDCGRMMTNEAAGLTLLDHAFNAMLMLSYVALSHGDRVGLITFSDDIHGYVPLQGGRYQIKRLLHQCFDQFPHMVESRYDKAFLYLSGHCPKRSLVVLVSNLIDEVNGNQIQQYLSVLSGRHLPLAVLLRDRRIFDFAEDARPMGSDLFRAAAAADILIWRHQVLADLHAHGILSLDVFPEELTAPLINQYLEIKARHLL